MATTTDHVRPPAPGLYVSPLAGRDTFEVCGRHFSEYTAEDLAELSRRDPGNRAALIDYSAALDEAEEDARTCHAPSAVSGPGEFIALAIPECGATWPLVESSVRNALAEVSARNACVGNIVRRLEPLVLGARVERAPPYCAPAEAMRLCAALCDAVARAATGGTADELGGALAALVDAAGGEPADFYATGAPLAAVAAALHAQLRGEAGREAYRGIVREGDWDAAR